MPCHCASVILAVSGFSLLAASASATTREDELPSQSPSVLFSIPVAAEHQFRTDISNGGSFDVSRFNVGLGAKIILPRDMDLSIRMNYSLDDYSFRGTGDFGDGWDDIHTLGVGAILSAQLSPDWRVFGGPVFQFSREDGASWSDSLIGGGVIGATYEHSDRLTIGGGFGVVSQIEDDVRFYPVIVLNWSLTDELTLTSTTVMSASGGGGVELVYNIGGGWQAGLGAASRFRRFRLDDNGPVPDGVGEERSVPIWGRVSYMVNDHFQVNAFVGVSASGKLRLENERGNRIARRNFDAAPFVGISGMLRF